MRRAVGLKFPSVSPLPVAWGSRFSYNLQRRDPRSPLNWGRHEVAICCTFTIWGPQGMQMTRCQEAAHVSRNLISSWSFIWHESENGPHFLLRVFANILAWLHSPNTSTGTLRWYAGINWCNLSLSSVYLKCRSCTAADLLHGEMSLWFCHPEL